MCSKFTRLVSFTQPSKPSSHTSSSMSDKVPAFRHLVSNAFRGFGKTLSNLPISTQGFFSGDILGFLGAGVGWAVPLGASLLLFILVAFAFPVTFATSFGILVSSLGTFSGFFLAGHALMLVGFVLPVPVLV